MHQVKVKTAQRQRLGQFSGADRLFRAVNAAKALQLPWKRTGSAPISAPVSTVFRLAYRVSVRKSCSALAAFTARKRRSAPLNWQSRCRCAVLTFRAVNAAKALQLLRTETLYANRNTVDTGALIGAEPVRFHGARIGFHGHFRIVALAAQF